MKRLAKANHQCRRCPLRAPSGRYLNPTLRSGRCRDWIWYMRGGKQCRRRYTRPRDPGTLAQLDRKSTRLNSSHLVISYAVFCLNKKKDSYGVYTGSRGRAGCGHRLTGVVCSKPPMPQAVRAAYRLAVTGHSERLFFFFNDTATTEIYTLSLHDALPIWISPHFLSGAATTAHSRTGG